MTDATLVKLKNAGDSITIKVASCGKVPVGKYPEVSFIGTDGRATVDVRMPLQSVERQFARLNLDYVKCIGETLTISRDPNASDPAKPYWGITVADASPNGSPPKAAAPQTAAEPEPKKSGAALYREITEYTLEKVVPLYVAKGIPLTMEGTAAIVATMYIAATRNGGR